MGIQQLLGLGGFSTLMTATGGTVVSGGDGYIYHVFLSPGTFAITYAAPSATYDVVIVGGGGGGGGNFYAGGGGGGGVVYGSGIPATNGANIPVGVAAGGTAGGPIGPGGDGASSSFSGVTALYGGGGIGTSQTSAGRPGANPGGASNYGTSSTIAGLPQPVPAAYVAYGSPNTGNPVAQGDGGAGAGGPAFYPTISGSNANYGTNGGSGIAIPAFPAPVIAPAIPAPIQPRWIAAVGPQGYFGGGGGGASYYTTLFWAQGGVGGGGRGGGAINTPTSPLPAFGPDPKGDNGEPGVDFTGGGGGGANYTTVNWPTNPVSGAGGAGGKGIVIVRYSG